MEHRLVCKEIALGGYRGSVLVIRLLIAYCFQPYNLIVYHSDGNEFCLNCRKHWKQSSSYRHFSRCCICCSCMQACSAAGTDLLLRSSDGGTTGLATPPVMFNVDLPYIGQSYCSRKVCHGNIYIFFFIFLTYTFGLCCVFFLVELRINIYRKEVKICMFMVS